MSNGIYCETLLRMRPLRSDSFWYALTFEREGECRKPKTFLCKANLARELEVGDVYLFSAKGRYILRFAREDVPLCRLPLEYLLLHLSFARQPWPENCRAIVNVMATTDKHDLESLAESVAGQLSHSLAGLPRCRYHWRLTDEP